MSDPNEPTWSKAWSNLQRIKQGQDFYVTPPPSANLEDRLTEEDRKKKKVPAPEGMPKFAPDRGKTGVTPDGGATPYGMKK